MTNKKLAIAALFVITVLMATTMAPTKAAFASTSKYTPFHWTDCNGNYQSGYFNVDLSTPSITQYKVDWSWPTSAHFGFPCWNDNFNAVASWMDDSTRGWSSDAETSFSSSNLAGTTYTIYVNGAVKTIYSGDSVDATQKACYDVWNTVCQQFTSVSWTAN